MAVAESALRDRLIRENLGLVRSAACKIVLSLPRSFEIDDLMSAGKLGLIAAADAYNPGRHGGTPFSAFARQRIRGAILDSIRRSEWEHSTRPPLSEASTPVYSPEVTDSIERSQQLRLIARESGRLSPLQRQILAARYGPSGASLPAIAASMGLGYSSVVELHNSAIAELRARCSGELTASRRLYVVPKAKVLPIKIDAAAAALALKQAAEVDELGDLEKELAPLRPKIARLELLRKSVRSRYDDSPADKTFEAVGERFVVSVGARSMESVVDVPRLIKLAGVKLVQKFARVTLKDLEANTTCAMRAQVISQQQTGYRTLKALERGKPELPHAA